jgi:hypothetical protein
MRNDAINDDSTMQQEERRNHPLSMFDGASLRFLRIND